MSDVSELGLRRIDEGARMSNVSELGPWHIEVAVEEHGFCQVAGWVGYFVVLRWRYSGDRDVVDDGDDGEGAASRRGRASLAMGARSSQGRISVGPGVGLSRGRGYS